MKCNGCDNQAVTKKGWCSVDCYRKNQHLVANSGRKQNTKRVEVYCAKCNKLELKTEPQAKKYLYCSIECLTQSNIKPTTSKSCKNCNSKFHLKPGKDKTHGVGIFCSMKCYKEYHSSGNHKYGRRVEWIKKKCKTCNEEFEVTPARTDSAKFCSLRCHNINNFLNMNTSNTDIENIIGKMPKELNIRYTPQHPLLGITVADFFVEPNIAIYADGDYWHSLPKSIIRDKRNNKVLKNHGFVVLRFLGSTIKTNPEFVKEQLHENII